jgi:DNA-binding NarL/FixJ family response regulator
LIHAVDKLAGGDMQIGVETSRAVENKRIFVVETDEIIRSALQFMLHDENETHELANLEQAYDKGIEWKPDLVLLGLDIVETGGVAVLEDIKGKLPTAKVVLIADKADNPLVKTCLDAGAAGVIPKPLTIEGVRFKVDVLLGRRELPMVPLAMLK